MCRGGGAFSLFQLKCKWALVKTVYGTSDTNRHCHKNIQMLKTSLNPIIHLSEYIVVDIGHLIDSLGIHAI